MKVLTGLQLVLLAYVGACAVVLIFCKFFPLPPLSIADFVVNTRGEIIVFSSLNDTFYIFSPEGRRKTTFHIPVAGGEPMLAVDVHNNIYTARRRSLVVYGPDGTRKAVYSTKLAEPESWRLNEGGGVEHFNGPMPAGQAPFATRRLRRAAKPGDVLFFQGDGSEVHHSIQDPFVDAQGNTYVCKGWFWGIRGFNTRGELITEVGPPLVLKPFTWPFPGLYGAVGGLAMAILIQIVKQRMGGE